MNILHISTSDSGGAGIACIRLHKELLNKKVNSKVLVLDKHRSDIQGVYPFFSDGTKFSKAINLLKRHLSPTINSRKLKGKISSYEIFSFPDSYIDITKHPLYQEADLIHLHFISEFVNYKSFFKKNEKPIIWTLHDMNPFTGGCHYAAECKKFMNECVDCPQLQGTKNTNISKKVQNVKLTAYNKNNNMIFVSPTEWIKEAAEKSNLLNKFEHVKINHGIDLDRFKHMNKEFIRDIFNIDPNKKVILYIADDFSRENKGLKLLLNSLQNYDEDYLLCTVGKAESSIDSLPDHRHLGYINDELLLAQIYSMSDVTVIPSVYESFSLTTLESLACGTPVIAFNNSGPGEIIINNETGITLNVGDIDGIFEAMHKLLNDKELLNKISHNARRNVEQRFDITNRTEDYIEQYNKLLHT